MSNAKFTPLQRDVFRAVTRAYAADPEAWVRAKSQGERVTLASLYYRGLFDRRAWRGKEGEADAAYEYRPAEVFRQEIDARRRKPPTPSAEGGTPPANPEGP